MMNSGLIQVSGTVSLWTDCMIFRLRLPCPMLVLLASAMWLTACTVEKTQLEQIQERGEIRLVTVYSPTTYMVDSDSESGFEYELARLLAEQMKLKLSVVVAFSKSDMIDKLKQDKADIAVGLNRKSYAGDPDLVAGPEYDSVLLQVVYHNGMDAPKTFDDLSPFPLHIPQGLMSEAELAQIKQQHPDFRWQFHPDENSNDLIELVHSEQIAYAAIYSNEFNLAQQSYPELRSAFDISGPDPLVWLLHKTTDNGLQQMVELFFDHVNNNEHLAELIEYYYGPVRKFDYTDQRKFIELYNTRLHNYEPLFRQAAEKYQFDWRLLAAISYQESHWNERARSSTGVRGMMMLTQDTARQMQIKNRLDPAQSIMGGARYIRQLIDAIPERIEEPDRLWLGLAAYNVGIGHLEDARIITQQRGGNPDKWQDVKESLPLLQQEQWHKQTANGHARGGEAVALVENIRKYYNSLIQLSHDDTVTTNPSTQG